MLKLLAIFGVVFLAELGDKTQLATLMFASDRSLSPMLVFLAASSALVLSTALAVLLGALAGEYLQAIPLKLIAGSAFIGIGIWTLAEHFLRS